MYAPIIIFAFNRPNALKNTVLSLLASILNNLKNIHLNIL